LPHVERSFYGLRSLCADFLGHVLYHYTRRWMYELGGDRI
jgi:hypothetical protein